ncbi:glycoside hydrolase family 72 protein [Lepidopterella palustris CBS 459.81]|uniref:1,3-beta-glucanosyltransferase n=1 Tax=Lepidopterella palustris CBS 459.81 TaxID=1314670 RepID=A0A8E2JI21_9PEZI|nr:glycoside hydrolase family 72 protein [Lepidopterella palustris CBS 459.81]
MISLFRKVALLLASLVSIVYAVHTIEVHNQEFVDTVTNKRLMIIGVDYQPGGQSGYNPGAGQDTLSNGTVCLRDAALLQRLGVNTIRVYNVDPAANHDECASIFNAVGIYMILDVNSPLSGESIDRSNPAGSYNVGYLTRVFGVVEAFKGYPNTLAFFSANEVMNDIPTSKDNPPYIRAIQRDIKNYIAKHSTRTIPVGYSAADVRPILQDTWAYLQCNINGTADQSRSDFFGLNSYSWCGGDATFQTSGYDVLTTMFSNSTIPVFFSEYGCNKPQGTPRVFNEVAAIYGPEMTALSGGLVYEYSEEPDDFGLVVINDNTTVSLRQDYDNLQGQYNKLNITLIESANSTATGLTAPACSTDLISSSGFSTNFTIPSPPDGVNDLINNGIKNPNNGKLVQVTATAVPMAVYASNGNQIQNLAITPLPNDESNTPGGETTTANTTSTASPSASPTKKGDAGKSFNVATSGLLGVALTVLLLS